MPQLPDGGGNAAVAAAIGKGVRFSSIDGSRPLSGSRIVVEFTVIPTGRVSNSHVVKNLASRFDADVLRAVRALPRFAPGRRRGVPVGVIFTIPIIVCLQR